MANFGPLKQRFLLALDRLVEGHGIQGSFLDYGCGRGDVAEHLARTGRFVSGTGYDPVLAIAPMASLGGPCPVRFVRSKRELSGHHDLVVLFDVIEHVSEPTRLLKELAGITSDTGWLAITVPYNSREWGVDDEFYGHLRRLSRRGVVDMLERGGWRVVRLLDPTFPSFWLIRRCYLLVEYLRGRRTEIAAMANKDERGCSLNSSRVSAWAERSRIAEWLSRSTLCWRVCRGLDVYFESVFWGFEILALCRRSGTEERCGVCRSADLTYAWSCESGTVWTCPRCRSQRMEGGGPTRTLPLRTPPAILRVKRWLSRRRQLKLAGLLPPNHRMLKIWSGGAPDDHEPVPARDTRVTVVDPDLQHSWPTGSFDAVVAHFVLDRLEALDVTLDRIDSSLRPGGFMEVQFFSSRSLLHSLLGRRWTGYDWNAHRSIINPVGLADFMGLRDYRLVGESQFSWAHSPLVALQSIANVLMPWQRNCLYDRLKGYAGGWRERAAVVLTAICGIPLMLVGLTIEVCGAVVGRGSVVRHLYRKATCAE